MSLLGDLVNGLFRIGGAVLGIKTLSTNDALFVVGDSYTYSDYNLNVLAAGTIELLIDTSSVGTDVLNIIFETPFVNASGGPVTVEFFAGTTTSANGTELIVNNRRVSTGKTPESKLYLSPTITSDGTRFAGLLVPSTTGANSANSATTGSCLPFEIMKGTNYLMRITNTNGSAIQIGYSIDFSENTGSI